MPKRRRATNRRKPPSDDLVSAEAEARAELIAAAHACIERDGLEYCTIASVAKQAGVSRPTLYRYFRDAHDLVDAALDAAGAEGATNGAEFLRQFEKPAEMAVEGVCFAIRLMTTHPILRQTYGAEHLDRQAIANMRGPDGVKHNTAGFQPLIEAAGWSSEEARDAVEVLSRWIVSLALAPEPGRSEDELRAFLRERMLPSLRLSAD